MKFEGLFNKIKKINLQKFFCRKNLPKLFLIFILIETIIVGVVWYKQESKIDIISQELQIVKSEKQQVEYDLMAMYQQYDTLQTNNVILNDKLELEKERILSLINDLQNSDLDIEAIKEFKHKSETIGLIMNDYIAQINKLNNENKALKIENQIVKDENQEFKQENKNLIRKVNIAKKLTANNITVEVLNKRNRETEYARKVFKIKICLTVVENKLIKKGNKIIYIRITDPNGYTLINEKSDIFHYNRNEIAYSIRKDINYENKNEDVCMYWITDGLLNESRHIEISDVNEEDINMDFEIKGKYTIDIFIDGKHITEKQFILK